MEARSNATHPTLQLVTNDQLLKRGFGDYCNDHKISFIYQHPQSSHRQTSPSRPDNDQPTQYSFDKFTLVLVDIRHKLQSDNYAGIDQGIAFRNLMGSTVAAIGHGHLSKLALLRIAEAGATYFVDLDQHTSNLDWIPALLKGDEPISPLPTQWELREQIGLRWDGLLQPLIASLREFPQSVWTDRPKVQHLGVSRRRVHELRRLASSAGFRPPEPSNYSTTFRRAPDHPEWLTVWDAGRNLLGWA